MGNSAISSSRPRGPHASAILAEALALHQDGDLTGAEKLYREVLDTQPADPDVLHLLGMARFQQGDPEEAVLYVSRAIEASPETAMYPSNLAVVLRSLGRLAEAETASRSAVTLEPRFVDAWIHLGNVHMDQGRFVDAADAFREATTLAPGAAGPWVNLGVALNRSGDPKGAIVSLERALEREPGNFEALVNLGNTLRSAARLDEAVATYRRALVVREDDPGVWLSLGESHKAQGRFQEAGNAFRQAIGLAPGDPRGHNDLGTVHQAEERFEEAAAAYARALELDPDHARAHSNMGTLLQIRGDDSRAAAAFQRALDLDPLLVDAWYNLGVAQEELGDLEASRVAYGKTIELDPSRGPAYHNLGLLHYLREDLEAAAEVFERWLEREPGNPVATHFLAAFRGDHAPDRASDAFVQTVFDEFARTFDRKLGSLGYQAPGVVADAVTAALGGKRVAVALDAGCGTGLSGEPLRPHADRLEGVDLSPRMLALARARGVYDALHEGELTTFLRSREAAFDLIVAVDTMNYFGRLENAAAAAFAATRPGGWWVFTLEAGGGSAEGFHLEPHGRYAHTEGYARHVLESAGWTVDRVETAELRQEAREPVHGLVMTARRPGGAS